MSLKDIGNLLEQRTPDSVLVSLREQIAMVRGRQERLEQMHALLEGYREIIEYARDLDEDAVAVRWVDERAILIGPPNDYSRGRTVQDNILDACLYFQERVSPLETNYPMWSFYEKESVENRRWSLPDRFYLSNPQASDTRRAGWYVTGCTRGGYGGSTRLFERLLAFIEEEALEIAGRSYVDYLLNEITVSDPDAYLIQVAIEVTGPPARA
jgi:hypothetical protein